MIVKKPMNIDDKDLINGTRFVEQPLSQPTMMTYPLLKIRLSEISRTMADRTAVLMARSGPTHEVTLDIDTEMRSLMGDIPPFFSLPISELIATYQLERLQAEHIAQQGLILYTFLHATVCTLHFPSFSRGFADSSYALSREACLQSARSIIQIQRKTQDPTSCYGIRFKCILPILSVFMASIILLMDLCLNKSSLQHKNQQRELTTALQMLEGARDESETAAKLLDSLIHVLRKHRILPPNISKEQPLKPVIAAGEHYMTSDCGTFRNIATTQASDEHTMGQMRMAPSSMREISDASNMDMANDGFSKGEDLSFYFNELAQNFEQGVDVVDIDWKPLFADFESSFL